MSEIIVSCAGCGKRYKGTPGTQKYKCANCANLFTYPPTPQTATPGTVLCSLCWAEVEISDGLCSCPVCSQKISISHGGRATAAMVSGVNPAQKPPATQDLASVIHERDELRAAKARMEKTMAELMERVAQVEEQKALERRGEAGPQAWELKMEVAELNTRLDSAKKHEAQLQKERDAAMLERNQAVAERDKALLEARTNARKVEELGGEPAVVTGSVAGALQHSDDGASAELQQALDAARAEISRLKDALAIDAGPDPEAQQKLTALENDLKTAREAQTRSQREANELAQKLSEIEQQLAEAQEKQRRAERDRDEATRQLNSFRDTAVSTLEPFAHDYRKLIKTSVAEAEQLLTQALRAREEVTRQLQKVETIAAELAQHLGKDGRELHSRLADLLGLPGDSGIRNAANTAVLTNGTADAAGSGENNAVTSTKVDLTETKV